MLAYGVVVRLRFGGSGSAWRFMLLRPLTDADRVAAAGLANNCDWLAWPLVYGGGVERAVYLASAGVEVVA